MEPNDERLTAFLDHVLAFGIEGWRHGSVGLTNIDLIATLPRVAHELSEIPERDANALPDAIEQAIEAALKALPDPNGAGGRSLFGFGPMVGKSMGDREEQCAVAYGHSSSRWTRLENNRFGGAKPRDWLRDQVAFGLCRKPVADPISKSAEDSAPYDMFTRFPPQQVIPKYPTAPESIQVQLQRSAPISTSPVEALLAACGLQPPRLTPPFSVAEHAALSGLDGDWAPRIEALARRGFTHDARNAAERLYEYLRCADDVEDSVSMRRLDAVLVAGARPRAMEYRVDELLRVVAQTDPLIVLSGLYPEMPGAKRPPISEAQAMLHYLRVERRIDVGTLDIVCEDRARNSLENIFHAVPHLHTRAEHLGRPLSVGIIAAPYQMRRLLLIAQRIWLAYPQSVNQIVCLPSAASIDLRVLLSTSSDAAVSERRRYGWLVYIQEYLKLFGGRAAGEF